MADARQERTRTAAVVTVSDGVTAGVRDDASGRALTEALREAGFEVARHEIVPDEADRIAAILAELSEQSALVLTTGGTGLGPRDVTPEATRSVIDREAPGLAEAMRAAGRASTPFAALSREVAGARGSTLIVNLPGSAKGATESLGAILPVLPHALDLLAGETAHGPSPAGSQAPTPEDGGTTDLERQLAARRAAGRDAVLVTAVKAHGAPPCKVGQKILVGPDGPLAGTLGCAEFDAAALDSARVALATGQPSSATYDHELGSIDVFVEPTVKTPRLLIFSATPVAAALGRWSREVGFDPLVIEPRTERHRVLPPATDVRSELEGVDVTGEVYAVHTDHDAPGLADAIAAMLRSEARFVGVMGSARHVGPHIQALRDLGFSDEDLSRVRSPVGLSIGARTAEEIALSILAGLVAARRGREGGWLDR